MKAKKSDRAAMVRGVRPMTPQQIFNRNLRLRMACMGLRSLSDVARREDISRQAVHHRLELTAPNLEWWSQVLGVPEDALQSDPPDKKLTQGVVV
jgi:hypothetical protein